MSRTYIADGHVVLVRYAEHGAREFFVGEYDTPEAAQAEAAANARWQRLTLNRVSTERLAPFFD